MMDTKTQGDKTAAPDRQVPFRIQFFLVDGFSMMALSSAIEPLRAANRLLGTEMFAWSLVGAAASTVASSNGMELSTHHRVEDAPIPDLTIVVASIFPETYQNAALFSRLRRLRAGGRMIGAVSNGTYLLARAGVLGTHRVTIHWEMARQLEESFPDVVASPDLYCWDRNVLTSSGGTASLDLMLALIVELNGDALANDVAEQFLHGPIRPSSHVQRQEIRWRYRVTDPRLLNAIEIMQANLASPVAIPRIAKSVGVSERQLVRLFQTGLKVKPSELYMDMRLRTARSMIMASSEPLESVAEFCGFSSLGHFSRSYKTHFDENPSETRRRNLQQNG